MSTKVMLTADENGGLLGAYGNTDTTGVTSIGLLVGAQQLLFDQGGGFGVRQRSTTSFAALTSGARTATPATTQYTNYNWTNMYIIVKVTVAGTGGLTPAVLMNVSGAGDVPMLTATQITTTGTYVYALGVNAAAAAGFLTGNLQVPLPKTIKINITHADASSWTYSVDTVFTAG